MQINILKAPNIVAAVTEIESKEIYLEVEKILEMHMYTIYNTTQLTDKYMLLHRY